MQVELVDSKSLGHSDQLNNVLQATFTSHPSAESNDNTFIWPTGACDFRPNHLCSSSVLYGPDTLEDAPNTTSSAVTTMTTTDPFMHPLDRARPQQLNNSGYHVMGAVTSSVPRVLMPFSDCPQPDLSPTDRRLFRPQPSNALFEWSSSSPCMAIPDLDDARHLSDGAPTPADDFIEPDMYCRNIMYPVSDGETSDTGESGGAVTGSGRRQPNYGIRFIERPMEHNGHDVTAQHDMSYGSLEPCGSVGDNFNSFRESDLRNSRLYSETGTPPDHTPYSCSFTMSRAATSAPSHPFANFQTNASSNTATAATAISPCEVPSDSSDTSPFFSPNLSSSPSSSSTSSSSYSCIHRPLNVSHPLTPDRSVLFSPSEEVPARHQSYPYVPKANVVVTPSLEDSTETRPLMMLATNELASGGSLTCTVVNILKGLRLLNRCGLEDLCASLYGLRNIESKVVANQVTSLEQSTTFLYPNSSSSSSSPYFHFPSGESSVIRSSSFTSAALVSPRRSTIPRDYSQSGDVRTDPAQNSRCSAETRPSNCLVNYILTCSRVGSSLFCMEDTVNSTMSRLSPVPPNPGPSSYEIDSPVLTSQPVPSSYLPNGDWRRGCASNLVNLLTLAPVTVPKSSRATVSRLVAGRFLMGPHAWRSVWPYSVTNAGFGDERCKPRNPSDELVEWISAWIRHGVVIVLAQLVPSASSTPSDGKLESSASAELVWCHRLVYGVSQNNEIYLSNPVELVPADDVLRELSRETTLCLSKSSLINLWAEHLRYTTPSASSSSGSVAVAADDAIVPEAATEESTALLRENSQNGAEVGVEEEEDEVQKFTDPVGPPRMHPHQSCVGDFSLIACQVDPRWNQMNVLGQVLQTLRGLDSTSGPVRTVQSTAAPGQVNHFRRERSSLSSSIVIPCAQSPGFSLFVPKSDWALVHALFYAPAPFRLSHCC